MNYEIDAKKISLFFDRLLSPLSPLYSSKTKFTVTILQIITII